MKLAGLLFLGAIATGFAADNGYLFTSFRDGGDGLHLASSEDGRDWSDLDRVFLPPQVGSKLMRDPKIIPGPDGLYHLVWTTGWKDLGIGYATSKDLVNWSEQRFLPLMAKFPGAQTCWAPELFYDEAAKNYLILWTSAVTAVGFPKDRIRAYYSLTPDFKTFTDPKILFDPGFNIVDTTMTKVGAKYALVFKGEGNDPSGKNNAGIHAAIADRLLGPYRLLPEAPVPDERAEGPALVTIDGKTLLYVNFYGDRRRGVYETANWKKWTEVTGSAAPVPGQSHGAIFPVPADLLADLRKEKEAIKARVPKPILGGFTADPGIRVFGDTYYVYPTTDKPNWNTTEFVVWSSKNLVDWKREGVALDVTRDLKWADLQAWAPDCVERNGTYYFYFCARGKIGVATAKNPAGPFKDALGRPLLQREKNGRIRTNTIDPYPFIDDDGQAWLYFGNGDGFAQAVKLKPDMITLDGPPVDIPLKEFREGIVVFKRDGKYYFMWSIDDARSPNYRVGWGVADSPTGPVTSPEKDFIVLQKNGPAVATAHHSVVNVPGTDRWYVAYHRHAIPDGSGYKRETCLVRMEFNPDGAIKPMDPMVAPFKPGDVGEPLVNGKGKALKSFLPIRRTTPIAPSASGDAHDSSY